MLFPQGPRSIHYHPVSNFRSHIEGVPKQIIQHRTGTSTSYCLQEASHFSNQQDTEVQSQMNSLVLPQYHRSRMDSLKGARESLVSLQYLILASVCNSIEDKLDITAGLHSKFLK